MIKPRKYQQGVKTYISNVPKALEAYHKDNEISADKITVASRKKVLWKCQGCENKVWSSPGRRMKLEDGSYKYISISCNACKEDSKVYISDLPKALKAYHKDNEISADEMTVGSGKKVAWKCKDCGNKVWASPNSKIRRQKDESYKYYSIVCSSCCVHISDVPEALKNYLEDDANCLTVGSNKPVLWKCQGCENKVWSSSNSRIKLKDGSHEYIPISCNACKGNSKVYISDILEAKITYIGNDADQLTVGSTKKVYWKCEKCGNQVLSSVHMRIKRQADKTYKYIPISCNACKENSKVYISDIFKASENYLGKDADKITVGSGKKVAWKCKDCGNKVWASPNSKIRRREDESYRYFPAICDNCKK